MIFKNKFQFNKYYFAIAVSLLLIEIFIALYINDSIIRPYIGDFIVVILIYCIVKSFLITPVKITCISVLIFSYLVEISQYFKIVEILHLQNIKFARIIIGTSFAWVDLVAYTAGIALVFIIEKLVSHKFSNNVPNSI